MGSKGTRPEDLTLTAMEDHPPYQDKIDKAVYEDQLRDLQIELLKLQRPVVDTGGKG